jgi:hypothetical protein
MALRWIALLAAAALSACAAQRAPTTAMGAPRACDLRIDVGDDHRCAVSHVTPPRPEQLITNATTMQEPRVIAPAR